nr:hypothetical protein [Tanacetum cinerariifolium]
MDVNSAFLYGKIEKEVYVCQPLGFEDVDFPDRVYKVEKALYMDVKSAFLYGKIKEEVYVCQPPSFEDPDFPDRVYKVEKALYGLHQTASTPMETHKTLLKDDKGEDVDEHLYRSMIESLMYLTSSRPDIMFADSPFDLVAYTDSDYAGASLDRKSTTGGLLWTTTKAKNINGEAQIHANVDGKKVIISEASIRRDLRFEDEGEIDYFSNEVIFEQHTLMSSTMASAIICLVRNQKFNFSKYILECMVKHLDSGNTFLMYPRFVQVFLNNQLERMNNDTRTYVIPSHTKKVFGNMMRVGKDFSSKITPLFPIMMVQAQEEICKGFADLTDPYHTPTIIQPSTSQPLRKHKSRKTKRKDTELPQTSMPTKHVVDEAVNEEMDGSLERATTTATSLDAYSSGGPRRQDTMGDTIGQTRSENVSKFSNDILLTGVNTPQSKEDSLKLTKLMELCTTYNKEFLTWKLQRPLKLMIRSLKRRVKRLDKKRRDEDIFGVNDQDDTSIFNADKDLQGEQVVVEKEVNGKDVSVVEKVNAASIATSVTATTITAVITLTISMDEITLAKALIEIKTSRSKAKGIVMQETSETPTPTPTVSSQQPLKVQDKGKGIMVEEPLKMKKKDQILFDAEVSRKLQEEIYEQEILVGESARQEEEANRVKSSRSRTYLKNMDGWKPRALKNKYFAEIKELFDKAMKRINNFIDFRTELVEESTKKDKAETVQESSLKRAGDELDQERSKK